MTNPSSPIKAIEKFLPLVEKVSVAAFAIGFVLKSMGNAMGDSIIIISLSALSVIYFLQSYTPLEIPSEANAESRILGFNELLPRTIVPKVLGIGSSVTIIGILFTLLNMTGFRQMLIIGCSSLLAASFIAVIPLTNEATRNALQSRLIRAIALMLIGAYFLWTYGLTDPMPYSK